MTTTHKFLLQQVGRAVDHLFKVHPELASVSVVVEGIFTPAQMRRLADDFPLLTGLSCCPESRGGLDKAFSYLTAKHPELRSVQIGDAALTDRGIAPLCRLEHLQVLNLGGTLITGENLPAVAQAHRWQHIKALSLEHCREMTDRGLNNLLNMCGPGLQKLSLGRTEITGEHVTATFARLEVLDLQVCKNVTDAGLHNMLTRWGGSRLKSLELWGTSLSGETVAVTCPKLATLDFSSCFNISAGGLDNLLMHWGDNLRELNLFDTYISDAVYAALCPNLEILSVRACRNISDAGLDNLLKMCATRDGN